MATRQEFSRAVISDIGILKIRHLRASTPGVVHDRTLVYRRRDADRRVQSTPQIKNRKTTVDAAELPAQPTVGYTRVSTEEQARGGISLELQEERIRGYRLAAGLELVELVREEGVSGAKRLDVRPGGKQLVSIAGWRQVRHVVALKLDRLFRDAEDALRVTRAWDKAGIAIHLIDMGGQAVNTAAPMGRLLLTMMAAFAELERNLIAERTAMALGHMKAHRQAYSPTPFGFDRQGDALVSSGEEQQVIQRIQAWRTEGWSLRRIAAALNEAGVATKNGGRRWYASTVGKILANDLHKAA